MKNFDGIKIGDRLRIIGNGAPGYANVGDEVTVDHFIKDGITVKRSDGKPADFLYSCGAERLELLVEEIPNTLPCPFCGTVPYWSPVRVYGNGEKSPATIKCRKCNYNLHGYDNNKLIEKWNTRTGGVNVSQH